MNLKPQDLIVALKVLTMGAAKWNQRDLAQSLGMSLSEVNGAIKRSVLSGLMIGGSRHKPPRSIPNALQEFITHGVRYAYPVERGPVSRGVPSGAVGAQLDGDEFVREPENGITVWPSPHGKVRGVGIKPLYKSVPDLVGKKENSELYSFLSLVDMIREGRARERNLASEILSKKIDLASKNV